MAMRSLCGDDSMAGRRNSWAVGCVLGVVMGMPLSGAAQTAAVLSGRIVDSSGGAVGAAMLSLASEGGAPATGQSDERGEFSLSPNGACPCVLTVERELFQPSTRAIARLTTEPIVVSLQVAGLEEAVNVVGAPKVDDRPTGQTVNTVDRSVIQNSAGFSIAEVVGYSPGVTVNMSNGPRDVVVSVRGSGARAGGTGLRNIQAFEDGFPITQPDGAGRTDAVDPHAYGAIDVFRGPAAAIYGNFALEGSITFRTRRPEEINGFEAGFDAGSFGYRNTYATYGHKADNYEVMAFGSVVRGDGFTGHTSYETYTFNALATLTPSARNRFTFKMITNDMYPNLSFRISLNQFAVNPYQKGCANLESAGCASISVFANGVNGTRVSLSAEQSGAQRHDRRTIVGGRWENFIDTRTTLRTQVTFDLRDIKQPTAATGGLGTYPSFNATSDITRKGTLAGRPTVHFFGVSANFQNSNASTYNLAPGGNATLGALTASSYGHTANMAVRAREEWRLTPRITVTGGLGIERTMLEGRNVAYTYSATAAPTLARVSADRALLNVAPDASVVVRASKALRLQSHLGAGYGSPGFGNLFVTPEGINGNNTQLKSMNNIGIDASADLTLGSVFSGNVATFYEWYYDEMLTQSPGINLLSYTFNAPRSIHKGVEVSADIRPLPAALPGLRWLTSYSHLVQRFDEYTERLSAGTQSVAFDRAGNWLPGVVPNAYQSRLTYDQGYGPLAGLGANVEVVHRDAFFLDNANQIKTPAYTIANLGVRYDGRFGGARRRGLNLLFQVQNLTNKVYVSSGFLLANSLNATTGEQNPASVLANQGSLLAGAPRTFILSSKITF